MGTDRRFGVTGDYGIKMPVRVATTGNITLYGAQAIDGVAVTSGDRVLVKNQNTPSQNGIYDADTGTWTRSADFDGPYDVTKGTLVSVTDGTVNGWTVWRMAASDPTIGTDAITFDKALIDDSSTITFIASGPGSVSRNAQSKMRDAVSIYDFIPVVVDPTTADCTTYIQAAMNAHLVIEVPEGIFKSQGLVARANQCVIFYGTLRNIGTGVLFNIPAGATNVQLIGAGGGLKGNLSVATSGGDRGVNASECGFTIDGMVIEEFGAYGVVLSGWAADIYQNPSKIQNSTIRNNGCGIETGPFEYCDIVNNKITGNGFNYAKTGFNASGVTCAGISGALSNIGLVMNIVTGNVYGLYSTGASGSNSDHNKIVGNTFNHNAAAGAIIIGNKNYLLLSSNTFLSNVTLGSAPTVVWPPVASSVDLGLVDVIGMSLINNAVGGGTYGTIPIYGAALCRWTNNTLLAQPVEVRTPIAGNPVYDTYGYHVNADNSFTDNWFYGFDRPNFFASSINYRVAGNKETTLGLVDDYQFAPAMQTLWSTPATGYDAVKYWREGGNRVRVVGSVQPTTGFGATAFILPSGFRPVTQMDYVTLVSSTGGLGYTRIDNTGAVKPNGAAINKPILLDLTFCTS